MSLAELARLLEPYHRRFKIGSHTTHDYTQRFPGHDYIFRPLEHGKLGQMQGWGRGISKGDYLLLENGRGSTRYQVRSINYYTDPTDMWSAEVVFAPRPVG